LHGFGSSFLDLPVHLPVCGEACEHYLRHPFRSPGFAGNPDGIRCRRANDSIALVPLNKEFT
jgi:hypothetical protein